MSNYNQITEKFKELEVNYKAFSEKGNSAAGTRARKNLMEIKNLSQALRVEIQEKKNS